MPRNGTGTYVLPAGQPVVSATTISSSVFNTFTNDVAAALTTSVSTDGQSPMTAPLPMGANKIINMAAATLSTDAARYDQVTVKVSSSDLADHTDSAKGAALVGAIDGSAGSIFTTVAGFINKILSSTGSAIMGFISDATGSGVRTAQAKMRDIVDIRDFPGGTWDGVADDSAAWNLAIASGKRTISARGITTFIGSQINLASNQTFDLTGSKIVISGSTGRRLSADKVNDWNLKGPFQVVGDGSTVGTCIAIYVTDCARWRVDSPTISSVKGHGIFCDAGTSTSNRGDHGVIANPRIKDCYRGYEDQAGTGGEYVTLINPHITGCTDFGLKTAAGNIWVIGGHIIDNLQDGVQLGSGSNHSHGGFVGVNINHNVRYNLNAAAVTNGESFVGCHFYANNNAGQGAIFLNQCKGITFDGGHLDCWVYNYQGGGSGYNFIKNMYCPGSYGDIPRQDSGGIFPTQLIMQGNTGPGAYYIGVSVNDPGQVYSCASRDPGASQSVGSSTKLIFPTEASNGDRRNAYNTGTGDFTVPTGMAGQYAIRANMFFSGTALSATASYIELLVNGATPRLFLVSPFGTTLLTCVVETELYLNAGDVVTIQATVSGTTPTFGGATWKSDLSIKRID